MEFHWSIYENESHEAKAFKQQEEKQMANPTPRDLKNHT